MKDTYNRLEVGERLRAKRNLIGLNQESLAAKINLSTKYYCDIERGSCGMSIETLLALGKVLDMPLDYIIYGKTNSPEELSKQTDETTAILSIINNASEQQRKYIERMLKLQIDIITPTKAD